MSHLHRHPLFANGQPNVSALIDSVMGPGGYRERGLVGVGFHPEYPDLAIFNYTDECTFSKSWDDVTRVCRGLILDIAAKKIVALGFPKFFNLSEQFAPRVRLDAPYEAREKMDGSLGICFFYHGQWHVATRGSFVSDQAKHATALLRSGGSGFDPARMNQGRTHLCEIIYPENRVVVSYGDVDDLCLLGGFDLATGEELGLEVLAAETRHSHRNVWTPEKFVFSNFEQMVAWVKALPGSQEGVVVRYIDTNERFKVKGDLYTALHRAISRLTPLNVWEAVRNQIEGEMKLLLPEEFYPEFDGLVLYFNSEFTDLWTEVDAYCQSIANMTDKDVGLMIDTVPRRVRRFVFTARKNPGSWQTDARNRNKLFDEFRPTANVCAR